MWRELAPLGRSVGGGYLRLPFTSVERECLAWFEEQAHSRGMRLESDGWNTIAWWDEGLETRRVPRRYSTTGSRGPGAVLTGSHLDSVRDGGGYDGALGVVSAFAAIDLLRESAVTPTRPLGVAVFAAKEASRFDSPCLGSRLATGAIEWAEVEGLRDPAGARLGDVAPPPTPGLLAGVDTFVELHLEQGRELTSIAEPVGFGIGSWAHGCFRFEFTGEADDSGADMDQRHDPMLSYAMTALAANKQARLSPQSSARATFGRIEAEPNATTAVPDRVVAWLDARTRNQEDLPVLVAEIQRLAAERAHRDGTTVRVTTVSATQAVAFDSALTTRLAAGRPLIATVAGHDAGVLARAGITTTMLLTRNPTGISHSPQETAELSDCVAGVEALADALTGLVS
ncbi:MAG: allantoate amidohydrolase [Nocardioidaceae bacterium]|nr:MAG: allantoate amidohydrolase [Nocardioidaceae bacterium]